MTKKEWRASADPEAMLDFLGRKPSNRKQRLIACACCYQLTHLVQDEAALQAVQVSEQYADGHVKKQRLSLAETAHQLAYYGAPEAEFDAYYAWRAIQAAIEGDAKAVASFAIWKVEVHEQGKPVTKRTVDHRKPWCAIIRDICNPFRPADFDRSRLTRRLVGMAQRIYKSGDFDRLSILADSLEAAGCNSAEIMAHCRGREPHVRGCWAVDMILGKE